MPRSKDFDTHNEGKPRNGNLGDIFRQVGDALDAGQARPTALHRYSDHSSWKRGESKWDGSSRYEITVLGDGFQCDLKVDAQP